MQQTAVTNGTPPAPSNGHAPVAGFGPVFAPDRIRELVAALEEPFEAREIKWRVTNTSQVGSRNGPRLRGQMLAYADPRAYTDRLNDLLTPSGWTRDYTVQLVQNFERKERGSAERTITAKIVVTCKVTIYGFAAHTGLGEEWADNENAGTAAEAQAFKRACSCFGLGRYLYDVEGQWVDLDEKKHPIETPRLPDWARPKAQQPVKRPGPGSRQSARLRPKQNGTDAARNGRGGLYRDELLGQVKALCGAVGYSLTRNVLKAVADVDDAANIRDMAKLTMAFEKLQDLARGVERLSAAIAKRGAQRYSTLCRELNLASDSIDEVVHLHLEHPVVRRLLSRFVSQGFVHHDLSRACLSQTNDAIPRVILLGRLALYGPGAARLHEEIIPVTARWRDSNRTEPLTPYARTAETETLRLLDDALKAPRDHAINETIRRQLLETVTRDIQDLLPHLQSRAGENEKDARVALGKRADAESKAMREILDLQQTHLVASMSDYDRNLQLLLEFHEDERRQKEHDRRYWSTRLDELQNERETEPERIRALYEAKARRVEPIGLVYLWPVTN